MKDSDHFLKLAMTVGVRILESGGEISRVEDSLNRMGIAYGAQKVEVFALTSTIIVTMTMPDGKEFTRTRRIKSTGTDFTMLEAMNKLSRDYCTKGLTTDQLEEELNLLLSRIAYPEWTSYVGGMLAAGSFAVFFGGDIYDGLVGAIASLVVIFLQNRSSVFTENKVIFNLICSLAAGSFICLFCRRFATLSIDCVMIGVIMLMIPGIAMTNSIRDIIMGDTIAGTMRFLETLMWSASLAVGIMLSLSVFGG